MKPEHSPTLPQPQPSFGTGALGTICPWPKSTQFKIPPISLSQSSSLLGSPSRSWKAKILKSAASNLSASQLPVAMDHHNFRDLCLDWDVGRVLEEDKEFGVWNPSELITKEHICPIPMSLLLPSDILPPVSIHFDAFKHQVEQKANKQGIDMTKA
jgi:hypothetical protein